MPMIDYENRFRDPEFVAVWERWQKARDAWRRATYGGGGKGWFTQERGVYDPDPDRMPDEKTKAAAREYLDSRALYCREVQGFIEQ